ncbi:MAG TPA: glycosyltransferase family 39 protein [Anaerolineales bacterium]
MVEREPTVLDYVKSKFMPWKGVNLEIPPVEAHTEFPAAPDVRAKLVDPGAANWDDFPAPGTLDRPQVQPVPAAQAIVWPWRSLLAFGLALVAQFALEPPNRSVGQGIVFYVLAAVWLAWAIWRKEWLLVSPPETRERADAQVIRREAFVVGLALSILAFLTFGGNHFTTLNVTLWSAGIAAVAHSLWLPKDKAMGIIQRFVNFVRRPLWDIAISRWTLLLLAATALVVFFRVHQLNQVPPEMFSDHAEKLLDVQDVLNGETRIFFPRNTGREAIQMYLTAAIARYLGTGISFASLKIGTILAGLLTLPFVYFLGKEVANRRTGLLALVFAGIAYWPNVISRVGLRFPLYPLFAAPALYFVFRGLRTSNRNDFILAGLSLGLGLHGYSTARILPVVIVAGFLVYMLHQRSQQRLQKAIWYLMIVALVSLLVFLPLGRFALENPGIFNYRTMTRLGDAERALPGPAWQIFLQNLWNALIMFFWSNGETWVHSVVYRPALDVVSAALFFLGVGLVLARYLRAKRWSDLYLILSVPLLMLPSMLSLAFPNENPSLNRTGGALVPVFVIVGYGLDSFLSSIKAHIRSAWGTRLAFGVAATLIVWSSAQNYDLVFQQYYRQFLFSAWNTTELGQVIRSFADTVGAPDSAWVVPYPHWVDTRLVGINAGYGVTDYALWPEDFHTTLDDPRAKMFLVNPEDAAALAALQEFYPQGILTRHESRVESKDFLIFFIPPQGTALSQ